MTAPPLRPRREIDGVSAVLLPMREEGAPDLEAFMSLLQATFAARLTPAVNMDTGYVNLLAREERSQILRLASELAKGRRFVAGAFIEGQERDACIALYQEAFEEIRSAGGTPILFQSMKLRALGDRELIALHEKLAEDGEYLAFELGEMFVPFGRIYPLDLYRELIQIPALVGAKHSSLRRDLEWQRLKVRDEVRPEFKVYTGNDLAIDMVMWGSDYLLGLSAFHPEAFALRDWWWAEGDARFYELSDALQYLGAFAFRSPVPAYKHTCAQFLRLRGRIPCDLAHPRGARRPATDGAVLEGILVRIEEAMAR